MDLLTHFKINSPKVVHDTIDNEVVIVEFDSGNYYSLDKAGADIWNLINSGASVNEIIEELTKLYKGNREEIEIGVQQLTDELQKEKLIVSERSDTLESNQRPVIQQKDRLKTEKPGFKTPNLHKYTDMQELLLLDPIHEVDEKGWPSVKSGPSDE